MLKIITPLLLVPSLVFAAVVIENPLEAKTFTELLSRIINFLFLLSLPVASLMIVFAAFQLLTSAGDPQKVETAKKTIFFAVVGVIVLFLSLAIVNALQDMLGVKPVPE